jgi:hypothetical protein
VLAQRRGTDAGFELKGNTPGRGRQEALPTICCRRTWTVVQKAVQFVSRHTAIPRGLRATALLAFVILVMLLGVCQLGGQVASPAPDTPDAGPPGPPQGNIQLRLAISL